MQALEPTQQSCAKQSVMEADTLLSRCELPVQRLKLSQFEAFDIELTLLRADQLNPGEANVGIGGNKLFKLLPNLLYAKQTGKEGILSFGGPWSNHLQALAMAARQYGLQSAALVRGERAPALTATLGDASRAGMDLYFVPRSVYRACQQSGREAMLHSLLGSRLEQLQLLPAGGSNALGVAGASVLGKLLAPKLQDCDALWMASGTGGTSLGVASGLCGRERLPVFAVSVLSNPNARQEILQLRQSLSASKLLDASSVPGNAELERQLTMIDGSLGRYAAITPEYRAFYQQLDEELGGDIDPVYMGKVFYALWCALKNNPLRRGSRIAVLHTGGQQGRRGYTSQATVAQTHPVKNTTITKRLSLAE